MRNTTTDPLAGVAAGRDHRPASLVRADPPMVDGASRIRVPAAQVQDRGHRGDRRSRGDPRPRHRRPGGAGRRGQDGISRRRRRRPGSHADDRPRHSRVSSGGRASQLFRRDPARLQPPRPARQPLQGPDQDPGEGAHARRVRAPGRSRMGAPARWPRHDSARGNCPHRRAFHRARVPGFRPRQRRVPGRRGGQPAVRAVGGAQRAAAPAPGLRDRDALAQAHRRPARGRHGERDGRDRRACRQILVRRGPRDARAEPPVRRRAAVGSPRAVDEAQGGSGSRRRTSAFSPTSSAARAEISARSPTRSRSRSPKRSSAASTTSTTCTTSAISSSTCPAA